MTSPDIVLAQLRASAAACEAALLNAQLALALFEGSPDALSGTPDSGADTTDCPHLQKEPARVMGGEPRDFCSACAHYIYPDGRVEAAT